MAKIASNGLKWQAADDARTMVVIPTIVGNEAKIKEMFDVLETFYIINKSEKHKKDKEHENA